MIAIRVDANEHIASGHVMRCLSIAEALAELGVETLFFTSDYFAEEMIVKRGFGVVCLNNDWNDKDSELDQFVPLLQENHPDMLLVDSYQVTERYLTELHRIVKLAYIDDLNAFDYTVDIVINYSVYAEELDYPPGKTYLLGMEYAPLRKQFDISEEVIERAIQDRRKNKQILITTGAADPYGVAEKIVREILKQPDLDEYLIAVVKGKFWDANVFVRDNIDALGDNASERVIIREKVENMAELMLASSMAVSAGGSTLYELCACCVPTITFSYADNQFGNVKGFEAKARMEYAGDARDTNIIGIEVTKRLLTYHNNNDIIKKIVDKMRGMNCRIGATHLAECLSQSQ